MPVLHLHRFARLARGKPARQRYLKVAFCTALAIGAGTWHVASADPYPSEKTRIAVFDFELEDKSAGGGIIPPDDYDIRYLAESTEEAKKLLSLSGRYALVPTDKADLSATKQFGIRNCDGCEAAIAAKLGSDQAMIGVITRVNRTEYTLRIKITDAHTGSEISTSFTDLRMGANYAWPRGVKWLMEKQVLARDREAPKTPSQAPQ